MSDCNLVGCRFDIHSGEFIIYFLTLVTKQIAALKSSLKCLKYRAKRFPLPT